MKCSVCGKEFGEGMTCQNCGVDRVTGLGNYSGYKTPNGNATSRSSSGSQNGSYRQEVVSQPKIVEVKSIVCYNCGEIIPADSKYCPHCSTNLYVACPKCGHEYSSQYPVCSACGFNRVKAEEKEWERKRKATEAIAKHQQWLKTPEGQEWHKRKVEERKKKEEEREIEEKKSQDELKTMLWLILTPFVIVAFLCLFLLLK